MNKKNTLLLILVVGVAYYYFNQNKKKAMAKELAAKIISSGKHKGPLEDLSTFGLGYLQAWNMAIVSGQKEFVFEGRRYNVQGGTAVR